MSVCVYTGVCVCTGSFVLRSKTVSAQHSTRSVCVCVPLAVLFKEIICSGSVEYISLSSVKTLFFFFSQCALWPHHRNLGKWK